MKSIKKYLFIMAALAAVFGFVACGDDDPSTVATYKADATVATYTVTFYDDDTFSVVGNSLQTGDMELAKGTYTGAPAKDGTIKLTFSEIAGGASPTGMSGDYTVKSGKVKILGTTYTRQ